jgi:hypothetical protein
MGATNDGLNLLTNFFVDLHNIAAYFPTNYNNSGSHFSSEKKTPQISFPIFEVLFSLDEFQEIPGSS